MDTLVKAKWPHCKSSVRYAISSISTCQYPAFRSKDINMMAPFRQSKDSSILGRLHASLIILEFNLWRSMQNLKEPSFLHTKTTGIAHGLTDFHIAPTFSMSSSNSCGGIQWYLSLNGTGLLNLISCFTLEVLPSSKSLSANKC